MQNFYQPHPYMNYMHQEIQNGGLVSVRSMGEAQNYPVAAGNSVTFKDENAPYMYVKTMGFSQLDRPTFEVFRLVKEEMRPAAPSDYRQEIENIKAEIESLKKHMEVGYVESNVANDKSVQEQSSAVVAEVRSTK